MAEKIKWVRLTTRGRNFSLLLISSMALGFKEGTPKKIYGWSNINHYRQFNNSRWFPENFIENHVTEMKKLEEKNSCQLLSLAFKYQSFIAQTKIWSKKLKNKDFRNENYLDLKKVWEDFFNKSGILAGAVYDYIFVNKFLPDKLTYIITQKVPDFHKQNYYLKILFSLDKASEIRKEKESILQIAKLIQKGRIRMPSRKFGFKINEHLKKYGYLGQYFYFKKPYTSKDIMLRLKNLLKKDIQQELKDLAEQKKVPLESKKIIKKLKLNKRTILLIKTVKEWAFAGNSFDENYTEIIYNLDNLIDESAKRLKITRKELSEMTPWEIVWGLERGELNKEFRKKLKERIIESIFIYEKGKFKVLSGKDLKTYYKKELKEEKIDSSIEELKGQPASPGFARGKVRLVFAIEEVARVKRGEILVAAATTPAHVPAMEKAAAIVTEEGGLLSHAAIVSRELGVPCVVGTKIATKVLRDGDLVEVDAERGVVKIIKEK